MGRTGSLAVLVSAISAGFLFCLPCTNVAFIARSYGWSGLPVVSAASDEMMAGVRLARFMDELRGWFEL
jgi:hypothetical protein